MTVDELAAAIRAYVGRSEPHGPDVQTWYIDIASSASDAEIWMLAEDIIRAGEERPDEFLSVASASRGTKP